MKRLVAFAALLLAACAVPQERKVAPADPAFLKGNEEWRQNRVKRLQAEDSWLSLVALNWLKAGENPAPANSGTLLFENGKVTLEPAPGSAAMIDGKPVTSPVALRDDNDGGQGPTVVTLGTMRYQILKRGEKYAVRVKDSQSDARTHFKGLEYYPPDPKYRVEARLEPHNPPKKITIQNVIGMVADEESPGSLVFDIDGKTYRLDPIIERGETDYFIIFKDETSAKTTYPAGRYLYASPAGPDGKVIVDFNRAYNPPCAFTAYATCPLPPPQNRLPIAIEAGEKKYAH